jgi:hypothetical protein
MDHSINDVVVFIFVLPAICGIFFWVYDKWSERVGKKGQSQDDLAYECCSHCGCRPGEQHGHDFACAQGCDREYA